MAIKFESASGPQGKVAEKRAAAPKPPVEDETKKDSETLAEEAEGGKASGKNKIKQRSSFKKK